MVLAAGEGTRLRPLTLSLPKPMVPVANVPLLARTLAMLARQGVRDIAVNLFHRPDAITDLLGADGADGAARLGVSVTFSHETTLMGTAGGVKRMEGFLSEGGPFLVFYGDNLYDVHLAPLLDFHRVRGGLATIATFEAENPSACGLVVTDSDGRVTRFQEKPPPEEVFTREANAGVYVLEPEVLKAIPPDTVFDFGKDIFPVLLRENPGSMYAVRLSGYLQDTGTVPAYRKANWDILEGRCCSAADEPPAGERIGRGLLRGEGARAEPGALFTGRNILGVRCAVGAGARLQECIVWEDCQIGAGAQVTGAILGRQVVVGEGAIIGDGAILADGVSVAPGARVPEGARIGPGEEIGSAA